MVFEWFVSNYCRFISQTISVNELCDSKAGKFKYLEIKQHLKNRVEFSTQF